MGETQSTCAQSDIIGKRGFKMAALGWCVPWFLKLSITHIHTYIYIYYIRVHKGPNSEAIPTQVLLLHCNHPCSSTYTNLLGMATLGCSLDTCSHIHPSLKKTSSVGLRPHHTILSLAWPWPGTVVWAVPENDEDGQQGCFAKVAFGLGGLWYHAYV